MIPMIIVNPINLLLYFVHLGINVTLFFLMVRLLLSIRSFRLLVAFDKAGEQLISTIFEVVSKVSIRVLKKDLPEKNKIAAAVILLTSIDFLLFWASKSLSQ